MSKRRRIVEIWYVELVVALMVIAAWNPCHMTSWALIAAMALCLPSMIVWLPALYVLAAIGWHLPGTAGGCGNDVLLNGDGTAAGTLWQVLLVSVFAIVIALAAATNVWMMRVVSRRRARRRRQELLVSSAAPRSVRLPNGFL